MIFEEVLHRFEEAGFETVIWGKYDPKLYDRLFLDLVIGQGLSVSVNVSGMCQIIQAHMMHNTQVGMVLHWPIWLMSQFDGQNNEFPREESSMIVWLGEDVFDKLRKMT